MYHENSFIKLILVYINILSLDRSRSTILNLYLSKILNGIALGEVSSTINPKFGEIKSLQSSKCACGKNKNNCKFWSKILNSSNVKSEFIKKTEVGTFIESSKTIKHSKWLRKNHRNNLVGIFLIRSFDEWSNSVLRVIKIKQEGLFKNIFIHKGFRKSALRLFLRRIYLLRLFEYYLTNIKLIFEVKEYKNKFFIFSSNDIKNLFVFKDFYCKSDNHIIRGNRSKSSFSKLKKWNSKECFHVRLIYKIFIKLKS